MANAKVYKGICYNCGNEYAKRGMLRHLKSCREMDFAASRTGGQNYLIMRVQGKYNKAFFLYLDVKEAATLNHLDRFLREIWLECCGHLSGFYIRERDYTFYPPWHERAKNNSEERIKNVLVGSDKYEYRYDFGTSTVLEVEILGMRIGNNRDHLIEVIARNVKPQVSCEECGAKATWLSTNYGFAPDYYCDHCVEEKEGDYGAVPLINTPRLGACGYPDTAEDNEDLREWGEG